MLKQVLIDILKTYKVIMSETGDQILTKFKTTGLKPRQLQYVRTTP